MRIHEFIKEANVTTADFSGKGGPKFQTQIAEPISLSKAFGSEGYNLLKDNGIKLIEKPSYWESLEQNRLGDLGFKKVEKLFQQAGIDLPQYDAWEVFSIDPDVEPPMIGPLATVENMPPKGVFVIRNLLYKVSGEAKTASFLVDNQGAESYIRFWRML